MTQDTLKIDGNHGEAGGQIVRTALALSTITGTPFEIFDIRKGRKDPGLKNQHLFCVKSLQQLSGAEAEGAELGSMGMKYSPGKIMAKNIEVDIETAGSITLLLQALLPPSLFANKPFRLIINGGTDVSWSTPFDYFSNVLSPQLQRFAKIEARLLKRGYYPKGGGRAELRISPRFKLNDFPDFGAFLDNTKKEVNGFSLTEQHNLIQIKGTSHASADLEKARVSERQAHAAQAFLARRFSVPINIHSEYQNTFSTGSGITLWAVFSKNADDINENAPVRLGSDCLGEQRKKAEVVGEDAAKGLIEQIDSKCPVDKYLADQILPYMAIAGNSSIKASQITSHCRTNIYTIEKFLGKTFKVDEQEKIISV